jgi:glycosyltransferase involved in cell wall biosynthesis
LIFFGALPFVAYVPRAPYFIVSDGSFHINYHDYNQDHSHDPADINRICEAEAGFLRRSAGVLLTSRFAADRIRRDYGISGSLLDVVGIGPGNVPPPPAKVGCGDFVLSVLADFARKQGRFAFECVAAARSRGIAVRLKFIGDKPPRDILNADFVEYAGWLDLDREPDRDRFRTELSCCLALMLPSRADLTPHVIPEASLYSKATIAAAVGGIPEMIRDGETGLLFSPEEGPEQVAERLGRFFRDRSRLREMGSAAHQWYQESWNWPKVAGRIIEHVKRALPNDLHGHF